MYWFSNKWNHRLWNKLSSKLLPKQVPAVKNHRLTILDNRVKISFKHLPVCNDNLLALLLQIHAWVKQLQTISLNILLDQSSLLSYLSSSSSSLFSLQTLCQVEELAEYPRHLQVHIRSRNEKDLPPKPTKENQIWFNYHSLWSHCYYPFIFLIYRVVLYGEQILAWEQLFCTSQKVQKNCCALILHQNLLTEICKIWKEKQGPGMYERGVQQMQQALIMHF